MTQTMMCPKCGGTMRTYNRNGVHIDQCDNCRGIFLDYGELEAISQLEARWAQQPPPHGAPVPPAWGPPHGGGHYGGHYKHRSFGRMLFSS